MNVPEPLFAAMVGALCAVPNFKLPQGDYHDTYELISAAEKAWGTNVSAYRAANWKPQ
jgi:hypothetical protein